MAGFDRLEWSGEGNGEAEDTKEEQGGNKREGVRRERPGSEAESARTVVMVRGEFFFLFWGERRETRGMLSRSIVRKDRFDVATDTGRDSVLVALGVESAVKPAGTNHVHGEEAPSLVVLHAHRRELRVQDRAQFSGVAGSTAFPARTGASVLPWDARGPERRLAVPRLVRAEPTDVTQGSTALVVGLAPPVVVHEDQVRELPVFLVHGAVCVITHGAARRPPYPFLHNRIVREVQGVHGRRSRCRFWSMGRDVRAPTFFGSLVPVPEHPSLGVDIPRPRRITWRHSVLGSAAERGRRAGGSSSTIVGRVDSVGHQRNCGSRRCRAGRVRTGLDRRPALERRRRRRCCRSLGRVCPLTEAGGRIVVVWLPNVSGPHLPSWGERRLDHRSRNGGCRHGRRAL